MHNATRLSAPHQRMLSILSVSPVPEDHSALERIFRERESDC